MKAESPRTSAELAAATRSEAEGLIDFVTTCSTITTFTKLETSLLPRLFALGRLLIALFLQTRHERLDVPVTAEIDGKFYRRRQVQSRLIATVFGRVRYWRTYMHGQGGGHYPLDEELRMPEGGFSIAITSLMARIATKVSYSQTALIVKLFLDWSPSTDTIEKSVLGLGKHTTAWSAAAPPLPDDGDVLIVMIDSKAVATPTEEELDKRRQPRTEPKVKNSPRHRGRQARERRGKRKRRAPGDKSKNGRAATLVAMYTLRTTYDDAGNLNLVGPINRRVHASFAPKRYAFQIARREADRRGFTRESGKRVQIVTDGDSDLALYAKEYFPEATHTLDIIHAIEYLWKVARAAFASDRDAQYTWVSPLLDRLGEGKVQEVFRVLRKERRAIVAGTPYSKKKREAITTALKYLEPRAAMMNYAELIQQDLEICSGPVEGAIRYVIGDRLDCTGMRWIPENAEALLQLRCIEINGEWDQFIEFVETQSDHESGGTNRRPVLQSSVAAALPRVA